MQRKRIKHGCLSAAIAGMVAVLTGSFVLAQGADPQVGTWKLNVAKSRVSPAPGPKSGTIKIEAVGAGSKVIVDQALADGSMRHFEYTANYDGKDSPVAGNNPNLDM